MRKEEIEKVAAEVSACTRCALSETRTMTVPGEGSPESEIMLIGEAPGRNEDLKGRPFVGRAGEFLDELLSPAGIRRETVFIANILKCRPPGNRNPQADEIRSCTPFLDRQIAAVRPKVICPMGNFASAYVLGKFGLRPESIGRMHGKVYRVSNLLLGSAAIIPLYHPASAVYNPGMRLTLIEDFRRIRELV